MDLEIINTVAEYIEAKIEMTECMQKHFRQVCHNCKKYSNCKKYNNYVNAWINLQKTFLKVTE